MNDDPTIAAIRKARHEISAEVGHDPKKLVEYYQRLHKEYVARDKEKREVKANEKNESAV